MQNSVQSIQEIQGAVTPEPEDQDNLWKMEEYKALRAEILANQDYQKTLVILGTGGLVAAFGFVFKDQQLEAYRYVLLTLIEIVALGFWYTWVQQGLVTERIGTYILLYFETDSALNWELFQRCRGTTQPTGMTEGKSTEKEPIKARKGRLLALVATVPFIIFSLISGGMVVWDLPGGQSPLWSWSGDSMHLTFQLVAVGLFLLTVVLVLSVEFQVKSSEQLVDDTVKRLGICLTHRNDAPDWQRFPLPRARKVYARPSSRA